MPNHVHFICKPLLKISLSKTFNITHMRYSRYINKRKKQIGHLWQGRFFSSLLIEEHLYEAVRYVENNALKAGLVEKIEDWKWSSATGHLGVFKSSLELIDYKKYLKDIKDWKYYLSENANQDIIKKIKKIL